MRIGIGIPTSDWERLPMAFFMSVQRMMGRIMAGQTPATSYAMFTAEGRFPVCAARNHIVRRMLTSDKDLTHLLFLDADHEIPADLLERLAAHDKPVITARYHVKRPPFHANAYVHEVSPGHFRTVHYGRGCFPIARGGAGALLITRDVLEDIGRGGAPWTSAEWFRYQRNPTSGEPDDFTVSEDFFFYERAQACGYTCWCDWDTEVKHLAQLAIGKEHNDVYVAEMEAEMAAGKHPEMGKQLIACGFDHPISVGGQIVQPYGVPVREAVA